MSPKSFKWMLTAHACTSQKVPPLSAQIRMDLSGILEGCDMSPKTTLQSLEAPVILYQFFKTAAFTCSEDMRKRGN